MLSIDVYLIRTTKSCPGPAVRLESRAVNMRYKLLVEGVSSLLFLYKRIGNFLATIDWGDDY